MSEHQEASTWRVLFGVSVLPQGTGRYVQDKDGWWRQIYSPGYTLLPNGQRTDVYEFEATIRMNIDPTMRDFPVRRNPWWKFWR